MTEVYGWNGTTVYTSTEQKFNGRDQVLRTRQFEGTTSGSTYQDVTMTYDGFGRMKTRHYPIEDAQTETTWNYNLDDSIYQIIDPRGAITDFTYNSRGLTTQIAYTPVSGVPDTPTVTFDYDNLGNRTSVDVAGITDTTYSYDSLSRLTKERVRFDELGTTNFDVDHSYNLSGGLASIIDPFGYTVNYAQDKTGRLSSVSGNALAQHSTGAFADNIQYRAFGATKQMDFKLPSSQTAVVKMNYNNRLQVSHFEATQPGSTTLFTSNADFSYMADGSQAAKDDTINNAMDRTNKYDFAGRITYNQFGIDTATSKRVYEQSANYDAFSNLTDRATTYWDEQNAMDVEFTDGRITTDLSLVYDAAGNIVSKGIGATLRTDTFDASGRRSSSKDRWASSGGQGATVNERQTDHIVDGDGRPVIEKLGARQYSPNPGTLTMAVYKYQVWSSVLGQAVATMDPSGNQIENRIYAGSTLIATARGRSTTGTSADDAIDFHVKEPVTNTAVTYAYNATTSNWATAEQEPFGQNISSIDPYIEEWNNYGQVLNGAQDPEWQCMIPKEVYGGLEGMPTHCKLDHYREASSYELYEWRSTKKNKVNNVQSGISAVAATGRASSKAIPTAATTATNKADKGGPSDSENPDIPDCGTQDCFVTTSGFDELGEIDTSVSISQESTRDIVDQAIVDALSILETEQCRDLFGSGVDPYSELYRYAEYPSDVLGSLTLADLGGRRYEIDSSGKRTGRYDIAAANTVAITDAVPRPNKPPVSITTGANIKININAEAPFVVGFRDFLNVGASDRLYRALVVIHELGHALEFRNRYWSPIISDSGDAEASRQNSMLIYDVCFRDSKVKL